MRAISRTIATTIIATGLLVSGAAPALAIDESPPQVNFKQSVRYIDGAQLSDSTSNPTMRVRVTWQQYDPSGICGEYGYLYNYTTGSYQNLRLSVGQTGVNVNLRLNSDYRV